MSDRVLSSHQHAFMRILERGALPLMVAPMFLVSGPELVCACARNGLVGSFPAANARDLGVLRQWMQSISETVSRLGPEAFWSVNMIVHSSYDRFQGELDLVQTFKPRIVSTALGSPRRVLDAVHAYGGMVAADVTTPLLARKAADAGADILILVTHGAGGHTGSHHPFALLHEVRKFWSGPLGLAGAITFGADILAAQVLGADFVVAGTRFIATHESLAEEDYRQMLVESSIEDLVATKAVSGVLANWLKPTLERAGFTPEQLREEQRIDFSGDIATAPKAWKTVWSAGHGVGGINAIASVHDVVEQLRGEYRAALMREQERVECRLAQYTQRSIS